MTYPTHELRAFTTIIFDLGDVLFKWDPPKGASIPPKALRRGLRTGAWADLECGAITEEECYRLIGNQLSVEPSEFAEALRLAQETLRVNKDVVELIRSLRRATPGLRVFAMSNISAPHFEVLRSRLDDWSIFDQVFTSAAAGVCKPDLAFYKHVIAATGCEPKKTIFVDDRLDNIISARSLGMEGIIFDKVDHLTRLLHNLLGDPLQRANAYLEENAGRLLSCTDRGVDIHENFAQLLILDLTKKADLVNYVSYPRQWNFFEGIGELSDTPDFPCDLETTSLAWKVLECNDQDLLDSIMSEMLLYRSPDKIVKIYYDHSRPRIDPVVCVTILSFFFKHGRGHELAETLEWVYAVLTNRAYLEGTRYYLTAEVFLFYLDRLISLPTFHDTRPWRAALTKAVQERVGAEGDDGALAMRLCVCASCGVSADEDLKRLLLLQCTDGGWGEGWIYRYPMSGIRIGNRGLTTAVAINAIQGMRKLKASASLTNGSMTVQ